jgi:hypothetical protein
MCGNDRVLAEKFPDISKWLGKRWALTHLHPSSTYPINPHEKETGDDPKDHDKNDPARVVMMSRIMP